ncbi:MAG TPA: cytochrome C oxidase subunit IV family protein [Candidatus Margulisiibacteriota bacterium]|nr:cytochrome C oxidase subunit IV family protein [Candidatus Margulisiibacteriota bacterium]
MSSVAKPSVGYLTIWVWLLVLLAAGVALLAVPSKTLAVVLIFTVASVKAFLVLRHYMHVRHQPLMVYALLAVPLLLAIALTIVLLPDIAFR